MNIHLHVAEIAEINVWTWVAGMALALLCLTAALFAGNDIFKIATIAPLT